MTFKTLIAFTILLILRLTGFASSAAIDSGDASHAIRAEGNVSLEPRQNFPDGYQGGWCIPVPGQPWARADASVITTQGIPYLTDETNPCNVGPGPGNCVRVSCSYGAAIYLCNDNNYEIFPSCSLIAQYASTLVTYCSTSNDWYNSWAGGQLFSSFGWNVIVRDDNC